MNTSTVAVETMDPRDCQEQLELEAYFKKMFASDPSLNEVAEDTKRLRPVFTSLEYVTAILCILGIVGNILNILVLSQKGLLGSMERMERSAHFGLLALALSDLLFCATSLPRNWVNMEEKEYNSRGFALYYAAYSDGIVNTFLLSSTWLTVTMASSRYLAICFPLRARQVIGMTFAKISIMVVFIVCILFNIPKYFTWRIEHEEGMCKNLYRMEGGPLISNKVFAAAYRWTYFVAGIFIPLIVLVYCNINLVRALQHSTRMQASLRATRPRTVHTTNRITLIFIIIILLYLLMVMPGEVAVFARDSAEESDHAHLYFNLAIRVLNTCQAVNFAFNFILYLVVNTHFRSQFCMLVHCSYLRGTTDSGHRGRPVRGTRNANSSYSRQIEMSTTEHLLDGTTTLGSTNGIRTSSLTHINDSRRSSEANTPLKSGADKH